jgi:predicted RNase H-like HicB family nuclease
MAQISLYSVYMEATPGEACMAHVAELPGCFVLAADESDALARLPDTIRQYRQWLHAHGVPAPGDDAFDLTVQQVVGGPRPWMPNGAGALFSIDRRLLGDAELELHLRVLACARADLLRAVHAAPRGAFDDLAPGQARTLRQVLTHLADSEEWLASRLGRTVAVREPDPVRRLVDVRARTLEHLVRYDREDRDLVFVPRDRPSDDPEEMWTLRKLLRRLIEHELGHLVDVRSAVAYWTQGTGVE